MCLAILDYILDIVSDTLQSLWLLFVLLKNVNFLFQQVLNLTEFKHQTPFPGSGQKLKSLMTSINLSWVVQNLSHAHVSQELASDSDGVYMQNLEFPSETLSFLGFLLFFSCLKLFQFCKFLSGLQSLNRVLNGALAQTKSCKTQKTCPVLPLPSFCLLLVALQCTQIVIFEFLLGNSYPENIGPI